MREPIINLAAIEPLFAPHEEPNQQRARAQGDQPSQVKKGRRPSKIAIAQSLRSHVKQWRETDIPARRIRRGSCFIIDSGGII